MYNEPDRATEGVSDEREAEEVGVRHERAPAPRELPAKARLYQNHTERVN